MSNQRFIFSENRKDRIKRHLLFWMIWGTYFIILHIASPMLRPESSNFNNVPFTALESFLILLLQVPITYVTLYFILPMYLQERKLLKAITWFIICWSIYYFLYQFALENVIPKILHQVVPEKYLQHTQRPPELRYFLGMSFATGIL